MSFKAKKLNIDLTLDITPFIQEEDGGILTCENVSGELINDWCRFAISEGERIATLSKKIKKDEDDAPSITELSETSRDITIAQIDYFYKKGKEFYKPLVMQTLNDMLEYINEQVSPVKKKSQNLKK